MLMCFMFGAFIEVSFFFVGQPPGRVAPTVRFVFYHTFPQALQRQVSFAFSVSVLPHTGHVEPCTLMALVINRKILFIVSHLLFLRLSSFLVHLPLRDGRGTRSLDL